MTTMEPMLSLAELADRLDVSRASLRRWLRDAGVRAYSFGRSSVRYRECDVLQWLEQSGEDLDDEEADVGQDDGVEAEEDGEEDGDEDLDDDDDAGEDDAEEDEDADEDLDDDCAEDEDD